MDFDQILKDLQLRANEIADQVDVDARVEDAKELARKTKERLETDEKARNIALGGAGLLAVLMATKGGRNLVGGVAKTGAVAALGALAWQAWKNREGGPADDVVVADTDVFRIDPVENEDFSRAVIETMALAAHADGNIDADEMEAIDKALKDAGADISMLGASADKAQTLEDIVAAARTPNHAAQLYAAACVATGEVSGEEGDFLADLADRLAIHPRTAAAIRDQAVKA